mmetsp:Transcript_14465/g.43307  ORF Transcript_14465/g.43307 Transcript_14465/m.43307 type:complete len:323 (+) Transcript_14465:1297-2265(+)
MTQSTLRVERFSTSDTAARVFSAWSVRNSSCFEAVSLNSPKLCPDFSRMSLCSVTANSWLRSISSWRRSMPWSTFRWISDSTSLDLSRVLFCVFFMSSLSFVDSASRASWIAWSTSGFFMKLERVPRIWSRVFTISSAAPMPICWMLSFISALVSLSSFSKFSQRSVISFASFSRVLASACCSMSTRSALFCSLAAEAAWTISSTLAETSAAADLAWTLASLAMRSRACCACACWFSTSDASCLTCCWRSSMVLASFLSTAVLVLLIWASSSALVAARSSIVAFCTFGMAPAPLRGGEGRAPGPRAAGFPSQGGGALLGPRA